jgi:FkbM family methyltransferase
VRASYNELAEAVSSRERIVLSRAALGARKQKGWMSSDDSSPTNQLVLDQRKDADPVQVLDGDTYCDENGIDRIGYLKVRTVGHDLQVLRGFHRMLGSGVIDIVQVEAGIYSEARRYVSLERFRGYLGALGYELFGLYSASRSFKGRPVLARVDAVFMSPEILQANTVAPG